MTQTKAAQIVQKPTYHEDMRKELEGVSWETHKNYGAENGDGRYPIEILAPLRGQFVQVAAVYHWQAEMHAQLIAAAPELLKALERLESIVYARIGTLDEEDIAAWENARAAISKAKGA